MRSSYPPPWPSPCHRRRWASRPPRKPAPCTTARSTRCRARSATASATSTSRTCTTSGPPTRASTARSTASTTSSATRRRSTTRGRAIRFMGRTRSSKPTSSSASRSTATSTARTSTAYQPPPQAQFEFRGGAYWYVGNYDPVYYQERPRYVTVNAAYQPIAYTRPVVDVTVAPPSFHGEIVVGPGDRARGRRRRAGRVGRRDHRRAAAAAGPGRHRRSASVAAGRPPAGRRAKSGARSTRCASTPRAPRQRTPQWLGQARARRARLARTPHQEPPHGAAGARRRRRRARWRGGAAPPPQQGGGWRPASRGPAAAAPRESTASPTATGGIDRTCASLDGPRGWP